MSRRRLVAFDFESKEIQRRPDYPPEPVGFGIASDAPIGGGLGKKAYVSWGHPSGNSHSKADAKRIMLGLWKDPDVELVFHHGKFDQDVGESVGLPRLPHHRAHDTLFSSFLVDPHSPHLGLKQLAERHLGMDLSDYDELRDWLMANVAGCTKSNWGAHISKAPAELAAARGMGDVERTLKLHRKVYGEVEKRSMVGAYDRERRLLPILIDAERRGMPVDLAALERDVPILEAYLEELDAMIRKRASAPGLDVDKKDQLADALDAAGLMTSWKYTRTGKRSVARDSILEGLGDRSLLALLVYRGGFATVVRTFLRPWLDVAARTGGVVHASWNQTRQSHSADGESDAGARTGRLSSNPNLMNVPTEASPNYERIVKLVLEAKLKLKPFPLVRNYVAAARGKKLVNRDYNQQELRILGHYEDGALAQAYRDDPWLDVHTWAQGLINGMLGTNFSRRPIKDTGFGLIYGMGVPKLAKKTGTDTETAKTIRDAYLAIAPGIDAMQKEFKRRAAAKLPIRTWGGREYHVEAPRVHEGRWMSFEYKLLNYLIQGSASDCTKQAVINLHDAPKWARAGGEFCVQVHDELLGSAPAGSAREAMDAMREAMEAVTFDVPMLSEGEWGRAWGSLDDFDDRRPAEMRKKAA